MLSYVLDLLESSNLKELIVVCLIYIYIYIYLIQLLSFRIECFNGFLWSFRFVRFVLVEQVVEGEDAALKVGGWISSACVDRLHVEVFIFL